MGNMVRIKVIIINNYTINFLKGVKWKFNMWFLEHCVLLTEPAPSVHMWYWLELHEDLMN